LTGLVGNVGMKALDGDHYVGPRALQFHIWPGSGLKKNRPRWVMAGELQETTRIFARNVARIEPEWIEHAAAHLVDRAHVEPHWDKARGEVIAYESVTLHGLVLVARRKVSYGRIDPAKARDVFIEGALVAGEFESPHAFWAHNRKLIHEIEELEHRARRPDVLIDDRALGAFYGARLPAEVRDARSFDTWYRGQSAKEPKLLFLSKADLMRHGAESITEELFPRELRIGDAVFPLAYRFEPSHPLDGVTINVPLALLNQVDEAAIDWLVPGMVRDKVAWTMKALPKRIRSQLLPVPEHVTKFLEHTPPGQELLKDKVRAYAQRIAGERLDDDIWSKDDPPAHLLMNVRIVDEAKRELAMGRDLADLRKRLGEAASLTLAKAKPGMEREGIIKWDFGDLPEQVTFRRGNQTGSARFTHRQCGLQILREEKSFHHTDGRTVLLNHVPQSLRDFHQAPGMFPPHRAGDGAVSQSFGVRLAQFYQAVASSAQRRVHPDDYLQGTGQRQATALEHRHRRAFGGAEAILHQLELPRGDAHCWVRLCQRPDRCKAEKENWQAIAPCGTFAAVKSIKR
jgi:ATP-dependent helicase HrpA